MENKVRDFNRLPRPQHTPTGLSNHWVFVIRRVPFKRPSDLVLAIHPQSSFMYQAGPAQILPLSTVSERAEALIPFLFDIFIKCSDDPRGRQPGDPQPFAPWTWATEDPELSAAVENGLKQHGVRKDLCRVGTWSANEKAVVDETWSRLLEILAMSTGQDGQPLSEVTPGDRSRCHGCGLSADIFTETLKQCSACKKACNPLRRLTLTGKDTPENIQLLFGPNWRRDLTQQHEEARIDILLDPPRGSPSYALHSMLDDGAPSWTPRPATDAEKQTVAQVRKLQEAIRKKAGAGNSPAREDMVDILTSLGPDWPAQLPNYQLAANAMDQGVRK
ncbi:hypothetical protein EsH8_VII_000139 [Colletotrichum jinshuiense]